jgi:hypothetical protein
MRRPGLVIFVAALLAAWSGVASADQYLPAIGGPGGGAFVVACKPGDLLAGFQLRIIDGAQGSAPGFTSLAGTGGYLDALHPVCATPTAPDHVNIPPLAGSWGRVTLSDAASWNSAGYFGGSSTVSNNVQVVNRMCPAATPIVTGISVNYGNFRGFVVVYGIQLTCGLAVAEQATITATSRLAATAGIRSRADQAVVVDPQAAEKEKLFGPTRMQGCPRGQVATGAQGRYGALVDAVGLICGIPRALPASTPRALVAGTSVKSAATATRSYFGTAPTPPTPPKAAVDAAHPAILYGIGADGVLRWYRHNGATTGAGADVPGSWAGGNGVSSGWGELKQVFGGGNGVIYGITPDGQLIWTRHAGYLSGGGVEVPGAWQPARPVAVDWGAYTKVFSGGDGVLYAITANGDLLWFRHTGIGDGSAQFEGPIAVASGWSGYELVFSGSQGIIYAAGADGILKWFKHDGYQTGAVEWQGPKNVGTGWNGLRTAFSVGNGIVYSIAPDGVLRWYRHNGYLEGTGAETPGAWSARADVGRGWNSFEKVIAQ